MFGWLLLLFILLPLGDLALLIKVGTYLHVGPTIALVLLTGLLGATLARAQGLATVAKIKRELASGRMPTDQLIEGAMILLAAAVLITPGFITDLIGLLLLVPPFRRAARRRLTRYFESRIATGQVYVGSILESEEPKDPGDVYFDPGLDSDEPPMKYVKNEAEDR